MPAALDGIRVFDASAGVAGPYATSLLALAGADVIKVEPEQGEWGRYIGRRIKGMGVPFLSLNRGKRSLALDLKQPEGVALARDVARQCDVIVESFRPGVMARLGLGEEMLRADRPDLVWLSISGFGAHGPKATRPALDTVMQAQSGWLDLVRDTGGRPVLMDYIPIDMLTGLYAAQALFAALITRFRFGTGTSLTVSLMEAATAFLSLKLADRLVAPDAAPVPMGVPTGIFPTAEGFISLAIKDDREFARLAKALGHAEWIDDPRFASRATRASHQAACEAEVVAALASASADEWDRRLTQADVVAAKILSLDELLVDPQFQALERIAHGDQPGVGPMPWVRVPGLAGAIPGPAPSVGEHSRQILREAGIAAARIDEGFAGGAVHGVAHGADQGE